MKDLMKKALACMLALTITAGLSGCGSKEDGVSANAPANSTEQTSSAVEENSTADEATSSETASSETESEAESEEEADTRFDYYELMDADEYLCFKSMGVVDGVIYYSVYDFDENVGSVRTYDIESGEDEELIPITGQFQMQYGNGAIYVLHGIDDGVAVIANNVEKYDLEGNLLASYDDLGVSISVTSNNYVLTGEGHKSYYLDPDLTELKELPDADDNGEVRRISSLVGNKRFGIDSETSMLYYFDLETESWGEIDVTPFRAEGHTIDPDPYSGGYSTKSWGKYLQLKISYRYIDLETYDETVEDDDFVIIDTDTFEVIARPQAEIFNDLYFNADSTLKYDYDANEFSLVKYPADGSDPVVAKTFPSPTTSKTDVKGIFDHGRYVLYDIFEIVDDKGYFYYYYVDLDDPDQQSICFYSTN